MRFTAESATDFVFFQHHVIFWDLRWPLIDSGSFPTSIDQIYQGCFPLGVLIGLRTVCWKLKVFWMESLIPFPWHQLREGSGVLQALRKLLLSILKVFPSPVVLFIGQPPKDFPFWIQQPFIEHQLYVHLPRGLLCHVIENDPLPSPLSAPLLCYFSS